MKSLQLLLPKNKKINCQKNKTNCILVTKSCNTIVSTLNSFCMWDKPLSVCCMQNQQSTYYWLHDFIIIDLYKWVDF